MTLLDDDEAAIKALNLDRLPTHIVDKRVTELMDLTGIDSGALERQHDSRPGGHVGLGSNPSRGPRSA